MGILTMQYLFGALAELTLLAAPSRSFLLAHLVEAPLVAAAEPGYLGSGTDLLPLGLGSDDLLQVLPWHIVHLGAEEALRRRVPLVQLEARSPAGQDVADESPDFIPERAAAGLGSASAKSASFLIVLALADSVHDPAAVVRILSELGDDIVRQLVHLLAPRVLDNVQILLPRV